MVSDAEKYKKEDEEAKARIDARNGLEQFAYNLRNSIQEDAIKSKISDDDQKKLADAIQETIAWVEANQEAEKEEYEHKQKQLEEVSNPIITKAYAAGGAPGGAAGGFPGGFPGAGQQAPPSSGPTFEEVDE